MTAHEARCSPICNCAQGEWQRLTVTRMVTTTGGEAIGGPGYRAIY